MKLPFIVTESNLDVRCVRLLILLNSICSKTSKGFDLDKLSIFDFLLKYPNLLQDICRQNNLKTNIEVLSYDYDNISTINIKNEYLSSYRQIKSISNILVIYKYLDINIGKETRYNITDLGRLSILDLNNEWTNKLKDDSKAINELKNRSYNQLEKMIIDVIGGNLC